MRSGNEESASPTADFSGSNSMIEHLSIEGIPQGKFATADGDVMSSVRCFRLLSEEWGREGEDHIRATTWHYQTPRERDLF